MGTRNLSCGALAYLLLLVLACGGSSEKEPTQDAGRIVIALKQQGMPIGEMVSYSADTDPNGFLGRQGQYIGKTNFADTRLVRVASDDLDVYTGGSVEVFAAEGDITLRTESLKAIAAAQPLFAEQHFIEGLVLLRLSRQLTAEQAAAYHAALKKALE
jgi:hypothetical protein